MIKRAMTLLVAIPTALSMLMPSGKDPTENVQVVAEVAQCVTTEATAPQLLTSEETEAIMLLEIDEEEPLAEETTEVTEETVVEETTEATEETVAEETTEATEEIVVEEPTEATEETVVEEPTEATEETVAEETTVEEVIIPGTVTAIHENLIVPVGEETTEATEETVVEETTAEEVIIAGTVTAMHENLIVPVGEETAEATEETAVEETTEATEETVVEEPTETEATEETVAEEPIETEATEEVNEETVAEKYAGWHTGELTARKGYITDSPCGGSETWYPDAPVGAVKMLENLYGFKDLKMTVREDGVRILSGTRPNGETFEGLVVVAADVRDINDKFERNINGIFERGEIVETSLGTGIVVDYCERAVNERKATGHIHIDIATDW